MASVTPILLDLYTGIPFPCFLRSSRKHRALKHLPTETRTRQFPFSAVNSSIFVTSSFDTFTILRFSFTDANSQVTFTRAKLGNPVGSFLIELCPSGGNRQILHRCLRSFILSDKDQYPIFPGPILHWKVSMNVSAASVCGSPPTGYVLRSR